MLKFLLTLCAVLTIQGCATTYIQAPTEKYYFICTDEFELQYEGCVAIITCALYGGNSADRDH